jgi:hypothetical protein
VRSLPFRFVKDRGANFRVALLKVNLDRHADERIEAESHSFCALPRLVIKGVWKTERIVGHSGNPSEHFRGNITRVFTLLILGTSPTASPRGPSVSREVDGTKASHTFQK